MTTPSTQLPSLLDAPTPAPVLRPRRSWRPSVPPRLSEWWRRRTNPQRGVIASVALVVVGAGLYLWLGPVWKPDYRTARMDRVMRYTLLTDEFNKLPVEERLKLVGQLVQRLRDMNSGDSVLLAGFASGIAGAARDQLEENASRLAIDMWDKYAKDYDTVTEDQREDFLEQAFVDFQKTMEAVGGRPRDISDTDRINEVRQQAARDRQAMRDTENQPPPEAIGRMASIMNRTLYNNANPAQRARGAQMMRDMVRHFRGQDVSTGKPKK